MPISCYFQDCKALLVMSLAHVSSAIASTWTFTDGCVSCPALVVMALISNADIVIICISGPIVSDQKFTVRRCTGCATKGFCICIFFLTNTILFSDRVAWQAGDGTSVSISCWHTNVWLAWRNVKWNDTGTWCLQLLEILEIYWNLKTLLEILKISLNLIVLLEIFV